MNIVSIKMQKDSSDIGDSGYLMRDRTTFCDFAFGYYVAFDCFFFSVAGSRIGDLDIYLSYPGQIVQTVVLPLRHCAAI